MLVRLKPIELKDFNICQKVLDLFLCDSVMLFMGFGVLSFFLFLPSWNTAPQSSLYSSVSYFRE